MAIVQAGASAITMIPDYVNFDVLPSGTVASASPTQLRLNLFWPDGTGTWDFFGSNFTYSSQPTMGGPAPDLTGGTLSRVVQTLNGDLVIDISAMTVSAAAFWSQAKANSAVAILSSIFAGDDTIYGSNQQQAQGIDVGDDLIGFEGNDSIIAGAGSDTLDGFKGNDFLDGGADTDAAFYGSARADYSVVTYAGTTGVIALGAANDGVDKLVNVELLAFADQLIATPVENFRPLDYIASYGDLSSTLGANAAAGFDHYLYAGAREGRSVTFNSMEYIASYNDLMAAFGANADAGATHYMTAGRFEGRTSSFNSLDYIASYGDLISAFGANELSGANHYITAGRFEGRSATFDGLEYIASYADLIAAFGANEGAGAWHFIEFGKSEGRSVSFNGLDYIASYGDLINAYRTDVAASAHPEDIGATHYISAGNAEHRSADLFNAAQYLANYADLQTAFGANTEAATIHYITQGYFEHRTDHHL